MNVASAGEAADLRQRQMCAWKGRPETDVPVHTFCRRRKSTAERLGRSPGSEVQSVLCGCFTFPGRWPSGHSKQRPHSQWRDRAGFTPDFPVMPFVGTQTRIALYHDHLASDKSLYSPRSTSIGVITGSHQSASIAFLQRRPPIAQPTFPACALLRRKRCACPASRNHLPHEQRIRESPATSVSSRRRASSAVRCRL